MENDKVLYERNKMVYTRGVTRLPQSVTNWGNIPLEGLEEREGEKINGCVFLDYHNLCIDKFI